MNSLRARSTPRVLGTLVVVIATVAVIGLGMRRFSDRGGGIPRAKGSVTIEVGDSVPVEVAPGQDYQTRFMLPPRLCRLTGRIATAPSGNGEFAAMILNDDELRVWSKSHRAGRVVSGRVTAWTPDLMLMGPGAYHLVVSNVQPMGILRITVRGNVACP